MTFVKVLLNGEVSARPHEICTRGRTLFPGNQRYPNCLGPFLTNITNAAYNSSVTEQQKTLDSMKSMAAAEAWDAALLRDPTWVLGSAAAWLSAMPMRLQWGWE